MPARAISMAELHKAVCAIPARGRTIILDAPFPLFRDKAMPATPQSTLARTPQPTRTTPTNVVSIPTNRGANKACYFLAARLKEDPGEDVFDGVAYGVFTYFLAKHLNALPTTTVALRSKAASGERWEEMFDGVSLDVATYMEGRQNPRLSAPYLQSVVFEAPPP